MQASLQKKKEAPKRGGACKVPWRHGLPEPMASEPTGYGGYRADERKRAA